MIEPLHLALWEPEIPSNTGNIARLCAATNTVLHLIGRPAFRLEEKAVRRAGLDYWPSVDLRLHETFQAYEAVVGAGRIFCIETGSKRLYTQAGFFPGACLVFGNETKGLPAEVRDRYADRIFGIPMIGTGVRSLNLANSAAIVLYEALRQLHGW